MAVTMADVCDCGKTLQLHYRNPRTFKAVEAMVAKFGATVKITSPAGSWMVPRHYVATHGLRGSALPELAAKYGWATA